MKQTKIGRAVDSWVKETLKSQKISGRGEGRGGRGEGGIEKVLVV